MLIFLRIHWLKMSLGKRWKSHFREPKFKHFLGETPSLGRLWRLNFSSLRAYTLKIHALPPLVCCLLLLLNTTSVWFTTLYLTWQNVLPVDLDIFISVASCLFVKKPKADERCYIQLDLVYNLPSQPGTTRNFRHWSRRKDRLRIRPYLLVFLL